MWAIVKESGTDDGYGGTTTISEFVPMKSEDEVVRWITTYGNHTKYQVIRYLDCQVQKTIRILSPVEPNEKCNCGRKICPICCG